MGETVRKLILNVRHALIRANIFSASQIAVARFFAKIFRNFGRSWQFKPASNEWISLEQLELLPTNSKLILVGMARMSSRRATRLAHQLGDVNRTATFITINDVPLRDSLRAAALNAIDLKDVWTRGETDLRIHENSNRFWQEFQAACRQQSLDWWGINFFRLLFGYVDTNHRRIYAVVAELFAGNTNTIILLPVNVDASIEAMLGITQDFDAVVMRLSNSIMGFFTQPATRLQIPAFPRKKTASVFASASVASLKIVASPNWFHFLQPDFLQVKRIQNHFRGKPRCVVIALSTVQDSIYWAGARQIVREFCKQGTPVLIISTRPYSHAAMEDLGADIQPVRLSFTSSRRQIVEKVEQTMRIATECAIHQLLPNHGSVDVPGLATLWWLLNTNWYLSFERSIDLGMAIKDVCLAANAKGLVVLPHYSDLGVAAVSAARMLGIPTISCPLVTVAGNRASLIGWEMLDYVACYGKQCIDAFRQVYGDVPRCIPVGNIKADILRSLEPDARRLVLKKYKIPPNRRIVLVATSHIDPEENVWIKRLARWSALQQDIMVVVKAHPAFPKTIYDGVEEAGAGTARVFDKANIDLLLASASICITDYSTVGADAILLGKPLVVANLRKESFPANDYVRLGVAWSAHTTDELIEAVKGLQNGRLPAFPNEKARVEFVRQYNWPDQGGAAEKLAHDFATICDANKQSRFPTASESGTYATVL